MSMMSTWQGSLLDLVDELELVPLDRAERVPLGRGALGRSASRLADRGPTRCTAN